MICIASHGLPLAVVILRRFSSSAAARVEVGHLGDRWPHGLGALGGRSLLGCGDALIVAALLALGLGGGQRSLGAYPPRAPPLYFRQPSPALAKQ
jgi:hypothetical protein